MNFKKNKVGIFLEWSLMCIMFAYKLNCMMPKEHQRCTRIDVQQWQKIKSKQDKQLEGKKTSKLSSRPICKTSYDSHKSHRRYYDLEDRI